MFTSTDVFDVGLKDEVGNAQFNPPSLRGVSQRDRLFHDNRAANLADVFRRFRHGLDEPLADEQIADLVEYLNSL